MARQRREQLFLVEHRLFPPPPHPPPANGVDIVVGSKSFDVAGIGMLTVDVVDDVLESSHDADGTPCRSNEAEPAESLALLLLLLPALGLRSLEGVLDLSHPYPQPKAPTTPKDATPHCSYSSSTQQHYSSPQQTYSASSSAVNSSSQSSRCSQTAADASAPTRPIC